MTTESFDVIVIGLGAHGSSALYHLSREHLLSRGRQKVVGIDRFTPPHQHGSSHGQSRIIRQAYHENPVYVPFVRAAYDLWEELERESGVRLLIGTGGLLLGAEDSAVVCGARLSAETHGLDYDWLDAADIRRRFPAFRPSAGTVAVWEKRAGILFPEECIAAFLRGAAAAGASIRCEEVVLEIRPVADGVEVVTSRGRYVAGKVIVSAGAWIGALLPELRLPLTIERQVVCWFQDSRGRSVSPLLASPLGPPASPLGSQRMPVYIWEYAPGRLFYGFPDLGEGIKIGFHHGGRHIRPEELRQDVVPAEISEIAAIAATYLDIDPVFRSASVCMYTNTPDEDFILDAHPACANIFIASPCSGHGFKFSSVIGKILSDWAMGRETGFDLGVFGIGRVRRPLPG
ncbi:MAG TPA: N-methyl-L-tryptophan oxidase [Puia sp.]|jgi:sarcosine oxidase|nr:N-methyl-L-tryptophan oxidase [Puia sp.]